METQVEIESTRVEVQCIKLKRLIALFCEVFIAIRFSIILINYCNKLIYSIATTINNSMNSVDIVFQNSQKAKKITNYLFVRRAIRKP